MRADKLYRECLKRPTKSGDLALKRLKTIQLPCGLTHWPRPVAQDALRERANAVQKEDSCQANAPGIGLSRVSATPPLVCASESLPTIRVVNSFDDPEGVFQEDDNNMEYEYEEDVSPWNNP